MKGWTERSITCVKGWGLYRRGLVGGTDRSVLWLEGCEDEKQVGEGNKEKSVSLVTWSLGSQIKKQGLHCMSQ